jgi:hypothetical protein
MHPVHGKNVDVVALEIPGELSERYRFYPLNELEFESQFNPRVADDAFIIGYPFSEPQPLDLPIWKRGSIASEPDLNHGNLPRILVDTATRSGLSGSPVVMQRVGYHASPDGNAAKSIFGRIRNFLGVYSGRIGLDEEKAQLGVVWKRTVIEEIINGCGA